MQCFIACSWRLRLAQPGHYPFPVFDAHAQRLQEDCQQ